MKLPTTFTKLILIIALVFVAVSADYLQAAWTNPDAAPPGGTVNEPVNTGSSAQTKTGNFNLENSAPTMEFSDTDQQDWWIHTNGNQMYFIHDVNDDGSWAGETPWPLVLTNTELYTGNNTRISNSSPRLELEDTDHYDWLFYANGGNAYLLPDKGSGWDWSDNFTFESDGDFVADGSVKAVSFLYSSDFRLKENIVTIEDPLEKILQLRGVKFDWKKDNKTSYGFVAQEAEKVLPELVSENGEGYKAVEYGNIVSVLVEAVKEQQAQIDFLESRISELE